MTFISQLSRLAPIDMPVDGRRRERAFSLVDPVGRIFGRGDVKTALGTLRIDWTRPQERALAYFYHNTLRFYQKSELGQYIATLARTGAFIDVGANMGVYSLIARLHAMEAVAIEPEPAHAEFLKRNEQVFGRVLAVALSDKAGSLPLYYNHRQPGATSLVPAPGFEKSDGSVEVTTFSALAANGALGPAENIRLIKIDVEGHEVQTVRGLDAFLRAGHRPAIWCEVRGAASQRAPNTYLDVCRFLEGHGYATSTDRGIRVFPQTDDSMQKRFIFDLLFTHETVRTDVKAAA